MSPSSSSLPIAYRRGRPLVMGILNVTPDSFSDGGQYAGAESAFAHAARMIDDGADLIDVGPESTRPGAQPVVPAEQIRRAVPVIARLHDRYPDTPISIDTRLAPVATAALDAGAAIVNDISALRDDPRLAALIAERRASVILMHMLGVPATMQQDPVYDDVVSEICAFLADRAAHARQAGIAPERIILDPGIGFGKTAAHNLTILRTLEQFVGLGLPVVLGASRKRFLARLTPDADEPTHRLGGSLACVVRAIEAGVHIVRVHDVRETRQLIDTMCALSGSTEGESTER